MEGDVKKPRQTQKENLESIRLELNELQSKVDRLYGKLDSHTEKPDGHLSKSIIYWAFGSVVAFVFVLWLLPLR